MAGFSNFFGTVRGKGVLIALITLLGDWLFYQKLAFGSGIGVFAFALLLVATIARPAMLRDGAARIALCISALFCGALVYDPGLLAWLGFGIALGIAILKPRTGPFDDAWRWFQRIVWQTMCAPFLPLLDLIKMRRVHRRRPSTRKFSLRGGFGALALPVGGTILFFSLFASANPVLAAWLDGFSVFQLLAFNIARIFGWGIWMLCAWNALRPRLTRHYLPSFSGAGDWAIPGVTVTSVTLSLIAFNLLFALQNAMDMAWLWGLAPLPDDMSLADYAHRGAYPLIVTALLAGLFVLVTLRPGSDTSRVPAIRWMVTAWIAQNILLVASSALRTLDYIEVYSLTILRIAALEWMALVAVGLALIGWRLVAHKSGAWLINANAAAAALVLGASTIVDHGAVAAQWNVTHAREVGGAGAALDLCYMHELGDSALLPLIALEGRVRDPEFRVRVQSVRSDLLNRNVELSRSGAWTIRGRQRTAAARAMLAAMPPAAIPAGPRDCNGRIIPSDPAALLPVPSPAAEAVEAAADATNAAQDAAIAAEAATQIAGAQTAADKKALTQGDGR